MLPSPWSVEELFQDENLLVSTKPPFLVCVYVSVNVLIFFFFSSPSFLSVLKLGLSQAVKLSLGIFLLSTPKQNKELLRTGCASQAFLLLSLRWEEQAQDFAFLRRER